MTSTKPPDSAEELGIARRRGLQVCLRSTLLLVAAICVYLAYYNNRQQIAWLQSRIGPMQLVAHELRVDDPAQITVIKLVEEQAQDNRWEILLPSFSDMQTAAGGEYRLCLATRDLTTREFSAKQNTALPGNVVPVGAGKHRIQLIVNRAQTDTELVVTLDDQIVINFVEPKPWGGSALYDLRNGAFPKSTQLPVTSRVVLFNKRFPKKVEKGQPNNPREPLPPSGASATIKKGPARVPREPLPRRGDSPTGGARDRATDGILLWIEPAKD